MQSTTNNASLTPAEQLRYARHLILPEIGMNGQMALKKARVLVVGAGGLGSPLLQYLAAAGIGHLGIIDPDRVSVSNLQRQILYGKKSLGRLKVEAAKERLLDLNPLIEITTYPVALSSKNALKLFEQYDIICDGTDNFPTRYLVNDACVLTDKPNVYGSIFRFEGQVSVFNALQTDGTRGANYRDIFPEPPPPGQVPSCAEGGVLGVLPGIVGSMQANEVIKLITGTGEVLSGKLLLFDALDLSSRTLKFQKRADTSITQLIDYEHFCGIPALEEVPEIDVHTFKAMQDRDTEIMLLDVRQKSEYEIDNLGGLLIPLDELVKRQNELPRNKIIIVHCQSGQRSRQAVSTLVASGFDQVFNLVGGLNAYRTIIGD